MTKKDSKGTQGKDAKIKDNNTQDAKNAKTPLTLRRERQIPLLIRRLRFLLLT
jgi:hypothetical protein